MQEVTHLINCLEHTPLVLESLLGVIPRERYRQRRKPGYWCIHEQVCHLVDAQQVLRQRFELFRDQVHPVICAHDPTKGSAPDYMAMDMDALVTDFPRIRAGMVKMLRGFDVGYWNRQGEHEAFAPYSTRILLRHCMNVDYSHLFSIEQLGLTRESHVAEILTVL